MIKYVNTPLLDSPLQTLVNPVNTVGIMGKGLALAFKERFPELFPAYQQACQSGDLATGKLWLFQTSENWILNFPTKAHWREKSKLIYVEQGLAHFVENYSQMGIESVAFPQLGCGLGGLNWEQEVKPLMESYLAKLPIPLHIHLYITQ